MLNRVIFFFLLLLFLPGTAVSQSFEQYTGPSITDFTIYKITPRKTGPAEKPVEGFNAEIDQKKTPENALTVKKTEKKPEKPAKRNQESAKNIQTSKKAIKKTEPPKNHNEKKTIKTTGAKQVTPSPGLKTESLPIKEKTDFVREIETTNDEFAEKILEEEHKKLLGFDKDKYNENLNKLLENDGLIDKTSAEEAENVFNSYDYIIKPSVSLGIVLLLMLVLAWLYSKSRGISPNSRLFGKFGDSDLNSFKILATSTLGQGKVIQLVEINGKQLVIGSTNNNINLLTEITPEEMENLQAKAGSKKKTKRQENALPEDEPEFQDADSYSSRYSDLYKEYTEKKDQ